MTVSNDTPRAAAPVVSVRPVVLSAPERGTDLEVRVSAPTAGDQLPLILFSHGFGSSMDAYAPLANFWAANGFVVAQPTHLDSRTLNVTPDDPRYSEIWLHRVADLTRILDNLQVLEFAVPGLAGRVDHERIAAVGHSWGGQTASMLLGARVLDADGGAGEDMSDSRVTAGALLSTTGTGGDDLTPFAAENFGFMHPTFADMTTPALIVAGDHDQSPLSVRGPDWFTDPYHLSPAPKSLLNLFDAEHSLGGIAGEDLAETTDENPRRVELIQELSTAYLHDALDTQNHSWNRTSDAMADRIGALGRIESK